MKQFVNTIIATNEGKEDQLDKKTQKVLQANGIEANGVLNLLPEVTRDDKFFNDLQDAMKTMAFQA
ncbi:MAG: hypothetical protein P9M13_05750 [Candidatus Ancaeobacter aquaticus]|nr:hypothetical protein [Candidatus Ancaeobacter aquaticus]